MAVPDNGTEVEASVRAAAAQLGVADFVYRVPNLAKGGGDREPGGGLLRVGELGAILQVKARLPQDIGTDDTAAANRWVSRRLPKAINQANGSRREIVRRVEDGETVLAIPERVADLPVDERLEHALALGTDVADWPAIIVLDHPGADVLVGSDQLVISKEDWVGLQSILGSVAAIVRYAERVRDSGVEAHLGLEIERYMRFYTESASSPTAQRGDPWVLNHPTEQHQYGFDVLNDLSSRLWTKRNPIPWADPAEYRRIVGFLDGVPPGMRATVGAGIADMVTGFEPGDICRAAIVTSPGSQLVTWVDTAEIYPSVDDFGADLAGLTILRHVQAAEVRGHAFERTLGIGFLRSAEDIVEIYCWCEAFDLPADLLSQLEAVHGPTPLKPWEPWEPWEP